MKKLLSTILLGGLALGIAGAAWASVSTHATIATTVDGTCSFSNLNPLCG